MKGVYLYSIYTLLNLKILDTVYGRYKIYTNYFIYQSIIPFFKAEFFHGMRVRKKYNVVRSNSYFIKKVDPNISSVAETSREDL